MLALYWPDAARRRRPVLNPSRRGVCLPGPSMTQQRPCAWPPAKPPRARRQELRAVGRDSMLVRKLQFLRLGYSPRRPRRPGVVGAPLHGISICLLSYAFRPPRDSVGEVVGSVRRGWLHRTRPLRTRVPSRSSPKALRHAVEVSDCVVFARERGL
jgi:hypothetical protein